VNRTASWFEDLALAAGAAAAAGAAIAAGIAGPLSAFQEVTIGGVGLAWVVLLLTVALAATAGAAALLAWQKTQDRVEAGLGGAPHRNAAAQIDRGGVRRAELPAGAQRSYPDTLWEPIAASWRATPTPASPMPASLTPAAPVSAPMPVPPMPAPTMPSTMPSTMPPTMPPTMPAARTPAPTTHWSSSPDEPLEGALVAAQRRARAVAAAARATAAVRAASASGSHPPPTLPPESRT
jgi:hypothetical protein